MSSGLYDGKIVVHFAGFGGACRGIELAEGRAVDDAINHDAMAIKCHEVNYPHTKHHHEDVFHVDPSQVAAGKEIDKAWFSPDCRHFSRAKGSKPVNKKIRALAWVVVKWATRVKPRIIFLENVREFTSWGSLIPVRDKVGRAMWTLTRKVVKRKKPVRQTVPGPDPSSSNAPKWKEKMRADGWEGVEPQMKPDPARAGETYRRWRRQLEALGYVIDTNVLNAADFGAPTHRRRFFLIARCDGQPINWPEPTHGPKCPKPWRAAAECIDWSLPCPSIFLDKQQAKDLKLKVQRPLKKKTLFRIANGLKRYVINSKKPFIVRTGHYSNVTGKGGGFRGQGTDEPLATVCGTNDKGIVLPWLVAYYGEGSGLTGHRADVPLPTVVSKERFGLASGYAVKVNHGGNEFRGQDVRDPFPTVTGAHGTAAIAASIVQYNQEKGTETRGQDPRVPLNTITSENRFALVTGFLARIGQYGSNGKMCNDARESLTTITSKQEHLAAVAHLAKLRNSGGGAPGGISRYTCPECGLDHLYGVKCSQAGDVAPLIATTSHTGTTGRGKYVDPPTDPLKTITGANDKAVTVAHLAQFFGGMTGKEMTEPLPTVTGVDHNAVVETQLAAFITSHYGTWPDGSANVGKPVDDPLATITGRGTQNQRLAACLVHMNHGEKQWNDPNDPLRTVTSNNHAGVVEGYLSSTLGPGVWAAFCRVYQFLRDQLGDDAPLPIVELNGQLWLIVDIGLRMLSPRELLNAQFSPELAKDYVLIGTKSQQVKMIGNSVPPYLAAAIVRANMVRVPGVVRRGAA